MKKVLYTLMAVCAILTLASFEKEPMDGDWEKMKWEKTSYTTENFGIGAFYRVPKEGGTYTFKCKNYPGFWLCNLLEVIPGYGANKENYYYPEESNPMRLECEVATVSVNQQEVTITIAPSEHELRYISLNVTAGDIFDTICFVQ